MRVISYKVFRDIGIFPRLMRKSSCLIHKINVHELRAKYTSYSTDFLLFLLNPKIIFTTFQIMNIPAITATLILDSCNVLAQVICGNSHKFIPRPNQVSLKGVCAILHTRDEAEPRIRDPRLDNEPRQLSQRRVRPVQARCTRLYSGQLSLVNCEHYIPSTP